MSGAPRFQSARHALDEFEEGGPSFTVLSDLSANVFAALLLVLILLLGMKLSADRAANARPAAPRTIEATAELPARPHRPMRPAELVRLLRQREGAPGLDLDLGPDTIVLSDGGPERTLTGHDVPVALERTLNGRRGAGEPGPVRLYVFDNRFYADVTARLEAAALVWEEVSVPRALRDTAEPGTWSPAYRALLAAGLDEAAFRSGLARLLAAAPGPLTSDGHVAGAGKPSGGAGSAATAAEGGRGMQRLKISLEIFLLLVGFATVACIEYLVPASVTR